MTSDTLIAEVPAIMPGAFLESHEELIERYAAPATSGNGKGGSPIATATDTPEPSNNPQGNGAMTWIEYERAELLDGSDGDDGDAVQRVCRRTGYDPNHMDFLLNIRELLNDWPAVDPRDHDADDPSWRRIVGMGEDDAGG